MVRSNRPLILTAIVAILCLTIENGEGSLLGGLVEFPNFRAHLEVDEYTKDRMDHGVELVDQKDPPTPIVFWHGMGDTAHGSIKREREALQKKFPNLTIYSVQIGSNYMEDEVGGYIGNVNDQIETICDEIINNKFIKHHGSFNAIGFSQGCQFLRGLIQRCPLREHGIKVKNFISLGGQHQGVFGLPRCPRERDICNFIRPFLSTAVYNEQVQQHFVQAQYWHDPMREEEYKNRSIFLADINNENRVNKTYRSNLLTLDNFVLVQFLQDEMVIPRESSLFGYFAPNQTDTILPLEKQIIFLRDRLGLRQLQKSNRLHQMIIPGHHLQYNMTWFMDSIASVYLAN